MPELNYIPTVAEKIRDLIKATFGDQFKVYRVGDPIIPGQSELPAIYVTETQVEFKQDATGMDGLVHRVTIQVVFNKKDEMGRPQDGNTLDTIIDNYVYGRDPSTGEYATESIVGVLRRNLTLEDELTVQQNVTVRKVLVSRPEEQITTEAEILIDVEELQIVNNRR